MMKRWLAAGIAALALLSYPGLTTTAQRRQGVDVGDAPMATGDLQFEYQFGIDEGERLVGIPSDLASGDRFVVRMRANQTAYACLFVTNGAGTYTLMRVADGEEACTRVGRAWSVLPDADAVMRLDENEGVERLYLVVSRHPIDEVEDLDEDTRMPESWLVALRDRYGKGVRWTHEHKAQSMNVMYRGARGASVVAVEQLTFNHF